MKHREVVSIYVEVDWSGFNRVSVYYSDGQYFYRMDASAEHLRAFQAAQIRLMEKAESA